jgi:hypothetical protein
MTPREWRKRAAECFEEHGLNPDYSLALELLVFGEDGLADDIEIAEAKPEELVEADIHELMQTGDSLEEKSG